MGTRTEFIEPRLFTPHPHLSDEINRRIVESEVEGGVLLHDLRAGAALEIRTQNRIYHMVYCGADDALICGHPEFCPKPVRVRVNGSTWGGSLLKQSFIGRGMRLEFEHPLYSRIVTSPVVEIRETQAATSELHA